ncbi:hypothetical protein PL11201_700182 [Planktothrix sp. PCC 11201]|nr:hypothetical protein PL11201_700182 [Planktothrix sp. PCC 11201]
MGYQTQHSTQESGLTQHRLIVKDFSANLYL